ncbi:MAG: peptidase dimerization domain-containing protein, partial [Clostridia bacterium]|nr:peptidase dimerization domain-containing protein [Clostridia bacterium]
VAFLSELYQFNAKLKEDKSKAFEVPYTSFNLVKIQGGTSMNRVPGECSLFFEYITSKVAHHKMIIDKVKALCEKYQAYMTIIDEVPLMNTFAETFVVKLEEITGKLRGSVAVTSDGNYIRNRNVILLGPGPITGNEKNEYISKFSFDTLVDIYEKIIREYCEVSGGVKATPTTSEAPAEPVEEKVEEAPSEEAPAKKAKK